MASELFLLNAAISEENIRIHTFSLLQFLGISIMKYGMEDGKEYYEISVPRNSALTEGYVSLVLDEVLDEVIEVADIFKKNEQTPSPRNAVVEEAYDNKFNYALGLVDIATSIINNLPNTENAVIKYSIRDETWEKEDAKKALLYVANFFGITAQSMRILGNR